MNIRDYFSSIERGLKNRRAAILEKPVVSVIVDDYNGFLHCRVTFWDDSYLTIYEVISTEKGFPEKLRYSYHYQKDATIFRYDNAPHHSSISTYPHHKHEATARIVASTPPNLSDVFDEIYEHLKTV